MNMMVSAAAITAAPSYASTSNPDQELIELSGQFRALRPELEAATDRSEIAWKEFMKRAPEPSPVLLWRVMDPVGYWCEKREGGKAKFWCNRADIEKLRGAMQYFWYLKEECQKEFDALPEEDQHKELGAPKPHIQHLFSKKPDKVTQKRVNELVAALDAEEAAKAEIIRDLGIEELDACESALFEQLTEIVDRMTAIPPRTVCGLQAKAKLFTEWYWPHADDQDKLEADRILALEIVKHVGQLRV